MKDNKKNIAIFIENYVAGGSDKIARDLVDNLMYKNLYLFVNKRNDFRMLLTNPLPKKVELILYGFPTTAELRNFCDKYKNKSLFLYRFFRLITLLARYPLMFFSICYFVLLFRHYKIDIFFSNNGGYPGGDCNRMSTIAASLLFKNNYHIVHNIASKSSKILIVFEWVIDKIIDRFSKVICVSNETKNALLQKRDIHQNPIVIYNGVRNNELYIRKEVEQHNIKFLCIGALGQRKNQLLIIESLNILKQRGFENFSLYIVGDEEESGYIELLKQKIKDYELSRIFFEGYQNDPYKYYKMCDIFLLTSVVESFALVRVEAMSMHMPVITTDVGDAMMQVINDENGYIVSNFFQLADALEIYLKEPQLIQQHGDNGYLIFCKKFMFNLMIDSYQKLLA